MRETATKQNAPVILVSIDTKITGFDVWYEVNCWRSIEDCFSFGFYASQFMAMKEALNVGVPVVYGMNQAVRARWIVRIEKGMK